MRLKLKPIGLSVVLLAAGAVWVRQNQVANSQAFSDSSGARTTGLAMSDGRPGLDDREAQSAIVGAANPRSASSSHSRVVAASAVPDATPSESAGRLVTVLGSSGEAISAHVLAFRQGSSEEIQAAVVDPGANAGMTLPRGLELRVFAVTHTGQLGIVDVLESDPEIVLHVSAGRSVTGIIEDEFTGDVVANAVLTITAVDLPIEVAELAAQFPDSLARTVRADAQGYFEILGANPASYRLEVQATDFAVKLGEVLLSPDADLDLGRIGLERMGALRVQLVGVQAGTPPQLSIGVNGDRIAVNDEGIGVIHVSPYYIPIHFSVWLDGPPMMNFFSDKELSGIEVMQVTVGGASTLEVNAVGSMPSGLQDGVIPFVKIRYVSKYGHRAEWSHELSVHQTVVCDTIDADSVSVDLIAARDSWPDVLANIVVPIEAGRLNTATIAFPQYARRLVLQAVNGEPIGTGVVTELRRPHDPSLWLAANRTDPRGSVPWPQVEDPHLYASGLFPHDGVESHFIDVEVPTRASGPGDLTVGIGDSISHRVRVMVGDEAWSGTWVVVLGHYTDQEWSDFQSGEDGQLPVFDIHRESNVDLLIDDPRVLEHGRRIPLVAADQVIQLTRK